MMVGEVLEKRNEWMNNGKLVVRDSELTFDKRREEKLTRMKYIWRKKENYGGLLLKFIQLIDYYINISI